MIPVSRPDLNADDAAAVHEAVVSSFVAGGPQLAEFEAAVAARCGRRYGVAVNNGTTALVAAVAALGLPKGSRVMVPAFTIVSAAYAIVSNGHTPVFVDVDPETWNVHLPAVEAALARGIDAAVLVETYASAPPMSRLVQVLDQAGVPVIEDAAEGFGGAESDRPFGSFGSMSTLSFYANKLITTGEGGMVLADDERLVQRLRSLRNLHFDAGRTFIHSELSGNFRLSNLQAALGLSQLRRADAFYQHRQRLFEISAELLRDLAPRVSLQRRPDAIRSSYWVFPVLIDESVGLSAESCIAQLHEAGVEARHFFYPLNRQPALGPASSTDSEVSFRLWRSGLYLPLGNGISEDEVRQSASAFRQLIRGSVG